MIVLDTSAAIEIATKTEEGKALRSFMREGERIISCDLMRAEAASAARSIKRKERCTLEAVEDIMRDAIDLVDEFIAIEELLDEAFRESIRLDHSMYDMLYFVLARRTGGTLFTLDRQLMKLCEDNGVDCIYEIPWEE